MGFASTIGYVVFFIGIIGIAMLLTSNQGTILKEKSTSMNEYSDIIDTKLSTDFKIINVTYLKNKTEIKLLNTGNTQLHIDKIDTYIDSPIVKVTSITSLNITPNFNLINPLLLDPAEELKIEFELHLNEDTYYPLIIGVDYGIMHKIRYKYSSGITTWEEIE